MKRITPLIVAAAVLTGCGGSGGDRDTASEETAAGRTGAEQPAPSNIGVGPITDVDVAALTAQDAARGAEIFEIKCTACHKLAERYVGPALAGVTERREPEWIMNMIMNPEQMVAEDPQAKELFMQFLTPMTNQNIDEPDARALLAFLMSADEKLEVGDSGKGSE